MIIGIDEAGRGALAGPVVAGAVAFKSSVTQNNCPVFFLIKDSKKLTDAQRREAFAWLVENVVFGVESIGAAQIDEIGIKPANHLAMQSALAQVCDQLSADELEVAQVQVDGGDGFTFDYPSEDIVKGDEKVLEISAASIIAKVTRDDYMIEAMKRFPDFDFAAHKGYGAARHVALIEDGIYCEEHRKSYEPLRTWLHQGRLF